MKKIEYNKKEFFEAIKLLHEYQVGNRYYCLRDNKIVEAVIYEVKMNYYDHVLTHIAAHTYSVFVSIICLIDNNTIAEIKTYNLYKTREEAAEAFLDRNEIPKKLLQVLKDPKPRTTVKDLIEKLGVIDPETDLGDSFWKIAKEVEQTYVDKITPEDISFSERLHVDRETGNASIGTPASKVEITLDYWDCECETKYIHPIANDECPFCKARREDMPNSRKDEVCAKNMFNCLSD